ncbi:MAG TPA: thymidine phosphorylase family protein [Burkholderiales bacterium]|nr:thymidine phosphorylase family protein [Burkholderiales bacterium]
MPHSESALRLRQLGIDTYDEPVIYMRADCHVCRSEGFDAHSRVSVRLAGRSIIATLHMVTSELLHVNEASLSDRAWTLLDARDGDRVELSHPEPVESLSHVRAKVYGRRLDAAALSSIVKDVAERRYSDIHLSAFITACAGDRLDKDETIALTRAMVDAGERISWNRAPIVDKHSVGGLPGNRTTPIVVAIAAAAGLTMPKTSSRAITSPAGTADTMETLAPVNLDIPAMRRVVEREGGCIVWGGAMHLSPADDILIRVERPLDLDSEGQMVASILSKKAAAGSTHVVIDMPVGITAKVRDTDAARLLSALLIEVGGALGMKVRVVATDGAQPVGRRIGPALEARDVLAVLQGASGAPSDLRERAARLAGEVLELADHVPTGEGITIARAILDDGRAWRKFQAICEAQGGMRAPPRAAYTHSVISTKAGTVTLIDNRRLARIAKLAGAPNSPAAGLELHTPVGASVEGGQPLFTVHAEAPGELAYALDYVAARSEIVHVSDLML